MSGLGKSIVNKEQLLNGYRIYFGGIPMLWNSVIVLNATELFTWQWLILCYMNFTQVKKIFKDFSENIETSKNIK